MIQYNVHEDNIEEAKSITPGKRSVTVSQLAQPGWYAVSALVLKKDQAMIMDKLETVCSTTLPCLWLLGL